MLQFIVQFLPLIFLCAAFGVVLLNFDSVSEYIVYVISMLIQPKELIQASTEASSIPVPLPVNKKKSSLFTPFIRMWTLFFVLFFPNMDIEKVTGRKTVKAQPQVNVYEEKTQEEVNKYRIKTYSVPSNENFTTFRSAMEPAAPLSSPFQQAFPDVVNIFNKINKIEIPIITRPKPQEVPEDTMNQTMSAFHVYDGSAQPELPPITPPAEFPPQAKTPEIVKPEVISQAQEPIKPAIVPPQLNQFKPVAPMPKIESSPLNTASETKNTGTEKFDAIAALEKKVSALKNESVKSVVGKVDYGDLTKRSSEVNNNKNFTITIEKPTPLPKLPITNQTNKEEEDHVVRSSFIKLPETMAVFKMLGKILMYTVLSAPLLIVMGSIVYFLVLNGFNVGKISEYPSWVTSGLEVFVKKVILKQS